MAYERLIKLPVNYVLRLVKPKTKGQNKKVRVGPVLVNRVSVRLQTFKRSTKCVTCGVEGAFFWLERGPGTATYHFNMYGIDPNGDPVLMTKDHIVPKSKGGSNDLTNMQTMCTKCNLKKGNNMP